MESLMNLFPFVISGEDETKLFNNFFQQHEDTISKWIKNFITKPIYIKNLEKAETIKNHGNRHYINKQLDLALKCYNESLKNAPQTDIIYALILGNRSAVHYEMANYKLCIEDIERALKLKYPDHLQPKLFIRKAECHAKYGEKDLMNDCKNIALKLLNSLQLEQKAQEKLLISLQKVNARGDTVHISNNVEIPEFEQNPCFLNSSSHIRLDYNQSKGRHVIANRNVKLGEILFKEKAFAFAPIFIKKCEFVENKCCYCLSNVANPIFCSSCVVTQYCSESCCQRSWDDCHKYECYGLQTDFWHEAGIGFPVLRALLKGQNSSFKGLPKSSTVDFEDFNLKFGSMENNYPYFDSLTTNLKRLKNLTPILVTASMVLIYLRDFTTFFFDISQFENNLNCDLYTRVGGKLVRHIAQFSQNSSIIMHWEWNEDEMYFKSKSVDVACGIFPAVSMMNHSCKPNISIYYVNDIVIVKAIKDIKEGDEIFNCYGIDYRFMDKNERQKNLWHLYSFTCNCEVCSLSSLEIQDFDSFLCINCNGAVKRIENTSNGLCFHCKKEIDVRHFLHQEIEAERLQANCNSTNLNRIDDLYSIIKNTFYKWHIRFETCYLLYMDYYSKQNNFEMALQYFHKYINLIKRRYGETAKEVAVDQLHSVISISENFMNDPVNSHNYPQIKIRLEFLAVEAKQLLLLYYPETALNLVGINNFCSLNAH